MTQSAEKKTPDAIEAAFLAKQISEEERDKLAAWKQEHRRIKFWRLDDEYGLFVVRRPLPHEAKLYYKQGADEHFDKVQLGYEYVKTCTLTPSAAACDEVFKDYPLFAGVVLFALSELAGAGFAELGKV